MPFFFKNRWGLNKIIIPSTTNSTLIGVGVLVSHSQTLAIHPCHVNISSIIPGIPQMIRIRAKGTDRRTLFAQLASPIPLFYHLGHLRQVYNPRLIKG